MKVTMMKWILSFAALIMGGIGYTTINALAKDEIIKPVQDNRPVVAIDELSAIDYRVPIESFGEVHPFEKTRLSVRVAGEVTYWNEKFVAGGIVAKGDLLMSIDKENYEAAVLQAQSQLLSAQSTLIIEQAKADVAGSEARRFPNKPRTDLFLRKPQLISAKAAVKSAQAAVLRAKRELTNCDIVAPYDALVVSRDVGMGQFINIGTPVAQLNNIEFAEITIPIAGFDHAFLPTTIHGVNVTVTQTGTNGHVHQGILHRDLGVVDSQTRMVNLVVRIDDPYGLKSVKTPLRFGDYVKVNFGGKTLHNVYRIPQDLVNNKQIWLVNDNNQLESRPVQVVREDGSFLIVTSQLHNKDKLVITLPEYPQQGMVVKVAVEQPLTTASNNNL